MTEPSPATLTELARLRDAWLSHSEDCIQQSDAYLARGNREASMYGDGRARAFRRCADDLSALLAKGSENTSMYSAIRELRER